VRYERVNLADIESSSDDDDYGKLFATERGRFARTSSLGKRNRSGKKKARCRFMRGFFFIEGKAT
jgi:hypothetical protein